MKKKTIWSKYALGSVYCQYKWNAYRHELIKGIYYIMEMEENVVT